MNTRKPVVLLAPLDWGLGHTVRCIPIVAKLLSLGCDVIVACNSKQRMVLAEEFANLKFVELPGYNVNYGKTRLQTIVQIILQIPRILTVINREYTWLKNFVAGQRIDVIISDNRYGFYSDKIPSIIITHQLRVRSGLGNLIDNSIQRKLYGHINRFSTCWIPDWADKAVSAAGALSHPHRLPKTSVQYIGCLSRLEKCTDTKVFNDVLIILSGPEPQRTIFENLLMTQLRKFAGSAVLVRGLTEDRPTSSFAQVKILNYASAKELKSLICSSEAVISRSGYTSIMDLLKLGKKSILVPTPGQGEQEYLGRHMQERKMAVTVNQEDFDLHRSLDELKRLDGTMSFTSMNEYEFVLENLVNSLNTARQSASGDFGKSKK